ncbi:MAG: TolC family protein [Planctomycetes bacterium]|nr:TolC family protein [Planctomycetota bacterium]
MRGKASVVAILAGLGLAGTLAFRAPAQEEPRQGEERKVVYLPLSHAVALALRNNHDIGIAEIDPRLAASDEMRALAAFDPTLFGSFEYEESKKKQASTGLQGLFVGQSSTPRIERFDWTTGVKKKYETGTEFTVQFTARQTDVNGGSGDSLGGLGSLFGGSSGAFNPNYETEALALVTHPILRNFGFDANLAEVRTARNNRVISTAALEDEVRRTIGTTILTYWDLVFAVENRELRLESLARAQRLLSISRAQEAKQQADPLAVLQAQVEVARVQGEVLQSEQDLENVEDALKRLIMPDNLSFEKGAMIVPTEPQTLQPVDVDLEESIRLAMQNRSDVLGAEARLENNRISIDRAKNQLLPLVNFKGGAGYFGLDDQIGDATEDMVDLDNPLWRVGVEVEFPLGNRSAQGLFDRSRLELRRNQISLDKLRKQVIVEVREAHREIATSTNQIATNHEARSLSEKQLEAETLRFERGLQSSNKNLLDFQEDLTQARLRELQAYVKYRKALVKLETSTGAQVREYLRLGPLPVGYRHLEER